MYKIFEMRKDDIPKLIEMWSNPFALNCNKEVFFDFLHGGENHIIQYLENQIKQGKAIVVKKEEKIVGYFAWMYFDFHNEKSAFCPIIGHATIKEGSHEIYHVMYNHVAQKWVEDGRFNHLWMIFNDDNTLKDMLYDIGFGSHVMDAYLKIQKPVCTIPKKYSITKVSYMQAEVMDELIKESFDYYLQSPIFLKRSNYKLDDVIDTMKANDLLVAWDDNTPIGFMNLSVQKEYDIENLSSVNTGLIDKVGAYIKPKYRGMGVGSSLLNEVINLCLEKEVSYLHVCYETANPFANKFWQKNFNPMIRSLRRTINKDMNGGRT